MPVSLAELHEGFWVFYLTISAMHEGIKAEKEGLKASEKSDHAVRDAADKVINISDKAARKADRKTGGLFSNIGNWLSDRYVSYVSIQN